MKPFFYGWWVVLYAGAASMLLLGATYISFGLYVLPVSEEFDLSRADINTAIIILNFGMALVAPAIGWVLDRSRARPILVLGAILSGASFAALGLSHSVGLSAALIGTLAIGVMSLQLPATLLVVRWFADRRARALALAALGSAAGGVLVAPATAALMSQLGWRNTLLVTGAVVTLVLLIPALFIRERPDEAPSAEAADTPTAPAVPAADPLGIGAILRMPQFWCIVVGIATPIGIAQAVSITLAPLGLAGGLSMPQAASLVSISSTCSILGMLLLSGVADKVNRTALLAGLFCIGAAWNAVLLADHSFVLLAACSAILGVTAGTYSPLLYALIADRFGAQSFATARGLMAPFIAVLTAAMIRTSGEIYDRTGNYDLMFVVFAVVHLAAAALIYATRFTRAVTAPAPAPAAATAP